MYCRTAYTVCAITEALNAFGAHYRCDLSAEITPAKILGPDTSAWAITRADSVCGGGR